uniref:Uncharacterized protein n=1 Tax=Anopheles epiroticus TaxID=199890 RepID=A0A182PAZ7_9DIPT
MAGFMDHFLILLHTCHLYCRAAIDWMSGHCRKLAEGIDAVWQHILRRGFPRGDFATRYDSRVSLHRHGFDG